MSAIRCTMTAVCCASPIRLLVVGRLLVVFLGALGTGSGLLGHDGHDHPSIAVKPAEAYRPTPLPDRIILTWAGDPATTQAVTWRTSTDVRKAVAEIAIADGGPAFPKTAKQVPATSQALLTDLSRAHFHSVKFVALAPATKYAYRVGDGVNWSEWFHFTTASSKPEPFSFIYFGDAQNDIRSLWSRVIREAYSDAPKARFMIHAGDLINRAEADAEWGEWFGAGSWLNAMVPSIPIPGNHEQVRGDDGVSRISHHWRPQFTLPENGPAGLEEQCFTLVYQDTRIIGLDSNREIEKQIPWFDKVLAENKSRWVVCTFHHPIFSTAKDRDNPKLRAAWKPILDKYRVDLVLTGHDHSYGRTGLETPSELPATVGNVPTGINKADAQTGTVYVVSVSGPKMYNITPKPFMNRVAEDTQLYQIIHIDGDSLRYEARTAVGEVYDAFTLRKRPGQINELIDQTPTSPARRRPPVDAAAASR
jgi:acid phosphatase type 7